jgi:hemerythrin-like domain-containing protein
MPVNIGEPPRGSLDRPLQMLRDCHRRIERFLEVLRRVGEDRRGGPLDDAYRADLAAALDYFAHAAPRHVDDEEGSLFPRLRAHAAPEAAARLGALESDHEAVEADHAAVEALGHRWLAQGTLPAADAERFVAATAALQAVYARHIAEEDGAIFPLAEALLSPDDLAAIGREMAARRAT